MASTAINRLMDLTKARVPGLLDTVLKKEFFHLMNEFFMETNLWQEKVTFTATTTTQTYFEAPELYTYDVTSEESGQVFRLMACFNADGIRVNATMRIPGEIVIVHAPPSTQTYTAHVATTVSDPVTNEDLPVMPEWVLTKYDNVILDGLVGRLMSQPAKPYSNPQLAGLHIRKFMQGMKVAKREGERFNVHAGQVWQFPQTFNRTR